MSIFNAIKKKMQVQKATAKERYRAILENPTDDGAGADELHSLIQELGISLEQAEQDESIILEIKTLTPIANETTLKGDISWKAKQAQTAFRMNEESILADLQKQGAALDVEVGRSSGQLQTCLDAAKRIEILIFQHKRLFE